MYDQLTGRYGFACPARGDVSVPLSSFRVLERLPGAAHPAVYRVVFACDCGGEHDGLVAHDDLDWAPLAGSGSEFLNLMTARFESVALELLDLAARRIRSGAWPWSFFCFAERRPRPVFPSAFRLLAGGGGDMGLAVECPSCGNASVNVVSREHVDVPFHNDASVGVVEHVFRFETGRSLEAARQALGSSVLTARRRDLAA
jgi:hypothetical protein